MRTCKFNNCVNKHDSHGYCANHARQYKKYGHPLSKEEVSESRRKNRALSSGFTGHKRTEESKARQSAATKGRTFNTGRTHFKKGAASWNKGIKCPMLGWNKGKSGWMSAEHREKLRQSALGRRPWNKIGEGVTPKNKLEREKFRKLMLDAVFERDDYTCQMCDVRGGKLHVDHIKRWSKYPELRYNMDNLRTLCIACHYYITFKRKMPEGSNWTAAYMTRKRG